LNKGRSFAEFSDPEHLGAVLQEWMETDVAAAIELLEGGARWLTVNATNLTEPGPEEAQGTLVTAVAAELMLCARRIREAVGPLAMFAGSRGTSTTPLPSILAKVQLKRDP